jgi:UDP-2,3-diacylglucosamine hydrolase
MVKAYFLSDIHLESDEDSNFFPLEKLLLKIAQDAQATHLFLLGDIFDLWMADHVYFKRKFRRTLQALQKIQERGLKIHYFEGNHDLDLKPYFASSGFEVHEQALKTELGGKKFLIEHGDQMDPSDRGYLFLRWFLRTAVMRRLGRALPGVVVQKIGNSMSSTSRQYTDRLKKRLGEDAPARRQKILEKILAHVRRVRAREKDFDFFVSGHIHERFHEKLQEEGKSFEVINLGSWLGAEKPFGIYTEEEGFHFGCGEAL